MASRRDDKRELVLGLAKIQSSDSFLVELPRQKTNEISKYENNRESSLLCDLRTFDINLNVVTPKSSSRLLSNRYGTNFDILTLTRKK